jgi:hypothetical protein
MGKTFKGKHTYPKRWRGVVADYKV